MFNLKKGAIIAFLLPLLFAAGCGMANQGENARRNQDNALQNVTNRDNLNDGTNVNDVNDRNNRMNVTDNRDLNRDNRNNNNGNNMESADDVADKVAKLKEVSSANVIVTDNNAYVAVVLKGNPKGDVTGDLKEKISKKVKETDKSIDNVFVSANPDFVDRMRNYGDRINNGEPIEGIFDEFGETINRIFPQQR
ncbi:MULTISPECIES: YhcN/YlaJ family sporulation lipoprotein [Bacillus]|uniref:YhcN/YlaJ family sporulation lipoprotein n=1 Tax=Bacillus TaxID=1386 RepID=UPI00041DEC9B|nr:MULTISPECIES: YhcN/YlaJ family sporulation lipoprotein [Bacillus]QHZ45999.1 YhcN/YlaJ family sporulation lipoprotein [Bacillus sp. NSP9.1]WFA06185.1 YhcN/YlaJ family sporulation lipoprotein [Bacillus sp. HSf4]